MKIVEIEFGQAGANILTYTRKKSGKLEKQRFRHTHYIYVEDPEGEHKTIFGDTVKRKKIQKFWETKDFLKRTEKRTFEDDLSYTKRWLIDHGHKLESPGDPRIFFYDIETTGFSGTDDMIVSIVGYDTYNDVYYELVHGSELEIKTEEELLLEFCKVIKNVDPDILSGWNSDSFDMPFILDRLSHWNIPTKLLSRNRKEINRYWAGDHEVIKIGGRVNIDYLKCYKKVHYGEMESYALDYVAKEELGVGKIGIEELPGTLWEAKDYNTLLRYNKRDVEIMADLDKKLSIFEFLDTVSDLASCPLEDTLYNSRIVDSYILRYTSSKGIILPSRRFTNKRSGYVGAKVLDPKKGIHENVGIFDLASLYPSIIITWNLSPETVTKPDSTVEPKGLVPTLLEDLFTLRREYRDQGLDNEQRVIKEIMNSFYGVMALPTFRLYEQLVASEITRHGREIIETTKERVNEMGYTVIYGDTDSVFVSGIPNTHDAQLLEAAINSSYDSYCADLGIREHRLKIEFEAFSPRTIMVKKKRYAMKLDDGTYKVAGFQMKRSDTQPFARTFQENVIHMILEGADKKSIREYYHQMKQEVLKGDHNETIGIPSKVTKNLDEYADGFKIRGALYSNEHLNKNLGAGDKFIIYRINHIQPGTTPTDSIALEYDEPIPEEYTVDTKVHWERINKTVLPLLTDIGALEKTKQASLGDFL